MTTDPPPEAGKVTVRFFAAARAAAGVGETTLVAATLTELKTALVDQYGAEFARVLPACGVLVDGVADHGELSTLTDGATVDVLPPFAGG